MDLALITHLIAAYGALAVVWFAITFGVVLTGAAVTLAHWH